MGHVDVHERFGVFGIEVEDPFPFLEGFVKDGYLQVALVALIQLLGVGPLGTLHVTVQLGGSGLQVVSLKAQILAGLFEG